MLRYSLSMMLVTFGHPQTNVHKLQSSAKMEGHNIQTSKKTAAHYVHVTSIYYYARNKIIGLMRL